MKKSYIADIGRFNKVYAIDGDDLYFTDKIYEFTKDLIGCCTIFAKQGNTFYTYCLKEIY